MCRIAGIWQKENYFPKVDISVLHKMKDCMTYGGPDASGTYISSQCTMALGHRRLSIIDLSEAANQPFRVEYLHLIFNGELYNYAEVKSELVSLGISFRTASDTEVLLRAWKQWGYQCLHKFRGMFAFAMWDDHEQKLIICRDRVGVKPMYWYYKEGLFLFASELKAFHEHPGFDKSINHAAIPGFLKHGYIKSPQSIYKYVHKLEPGSILTISGDADIEKIKYWDIKEIYTNATPSTESEPVLIDQCEKLLKESFNLRMVADVPVGIFLSGGIDSSIVTALIQKDRDTPLKTFTIGFHEKEYNEAGHAKKISKHLGTEHYEFYCSEKEFIEVLPEYFDMYDEPFGDNSGIPTYLVSRLAKEHVKVSLSADGGDEVFGGYLKYSANHRYYHKLAKIPVPLRRSASGLLTALGHDRTVKIFKSLPWTSNIDNLEWRVSKILNAMKAKDPIEFQDLISSYISDKSLDELVNYKASLNGSSEAWPIKENLVYSLLGAIDITTYLEGDILTKVDRATMQHALEGREPFLDQHIIEFAMQLPDNYKLRNGETKWILKQILDKYVPRELMERPKQGFAVPTKKWLHTILFDELDGIYQDKKFMECFQFNALPLKAIIQNFKNNSSKQENPYLVWFLYCLYGWYKRWC